MNFLKKLMLLFSGRKNPTFLDIWERLENPRFVIMLLEAGLLGGSVNIFIFWENDKGHFFEEAIINTSDGEIETINQSDLSALEFDRIKSEIHRLDQPRLKNYSSEMKDGVEYSICWGSLQHTRKVSANNPEGESKHGQLVSLLKRSVSSL